MLLKFRGRCSFRQYMPSKPGRYGIKFWILADVQNNYCYNTMPFLGKDGDKVADDLGATVVKKLVEPLHNSGRNITCHRYFTGVETLKIINLTVVGTVMPNRKHSPVKLTKKQVVYSDLHYLLLKMILLCVGRFKKRRCLSFCYQLLINLTRLVRVENQK